MINSYEIANVTRTNGTWSDYAVDLSRFDILPEISELWLVITHSSDNWWVSHWALTEEEAQSILNKVEAEDKFWSGKKNLYYER